MTNQSFKPDFIVDQFGNAQDVRQQEPSPQPATVSSPNRTSDRVTFRSSHKSNSRLVLIPIPIGLIITILAYLTYGGEIRANNYLDSGNSNYNAGRYAQAITEYDKAIETKPDFGQAYNNRGLAYLAQGNYDKAIADFDKAIQFLPTLASAYSNRGLVYFSEDDYDKAIADFDQAIQLNPGFAKAFFNRGLTFSATGDYDKAIADFVEAIQLTPEYAHAQKTSTGTISPWSPGIPELPYYQFDADVPLAYANLGRIYLIKGENVLARAFLNKALKLGLDPSDEQTVRELLEMAR